MLFNTKNIVTLFVCLLMALWANANGECVRLTVDGRNNPLGVDNHQPRFGWQIASDKQNVIQQNYRVRVATTPTLLKQGGCDVWDSGIMETDRSQWIEYNGLPLMPNTQYYWMVEAQTTVGKMVSDISTWTTGMLHADNWKGEWIGLDSITPDVVLERHSRIAVRHLRKSFITGNKVKRATAHVCGLGYYVFHLNGKRIGNYLLAPAPTQYDKAVIYDTYDVTEQVASYPNSQNIIEVMLGPGYYFPPTQNYQTNVRSAYGMPKLRMNLVLEYSDGTTETIATDTTWQVAIDGPIRYANIYDGTLIDYRMKPAKWMQAEKVDAPCKEMRGNALGGVVACGNDSSVKITDTGRGSFILDFATNNTGRIYLPNVTIANGDTIVVRYAETLKDDGRELYTANLRAAENANYFVGNGKSICLTTEFVWHGFRYIEVVGLSRNDAARITRQIMTDDLVSKASIVVDEGEGMINRIVDNARRGILSNYKGMPMDCPQRDERMPWLGDRTMGCFGESYLTNNHTLYAKWLRDICDAQRKDGCISDVSPSYWRLYNGNMTWPAALPFGMEMMLLHYGDELPMKSLYDNVKMFLAFAKRKSGKDNLIMYDRYGDWCVPPSTLHEVHTKDSTRLTDGALISSCYYYYICKMMSRYANMMDKTDDEAYFDKEASNTQDAINKRFLNGGNYANGTVTANLLPLAMGIVPEAERKAVEENFMRRVKGTSGEPHIDCGVIGISWLMRYLSANGMGDIAYSIASTKTYPGWGYMAENGATTIWELWNGNTANPSMNSGNHVMMLGDFLPWTYECLAGIAPDNKKPGFKHVVMKPDFSISSIKGADALYPSFYGDIKSCWKKADGRITWHVTIPANTTATLHMPSGEVREIGSGNYTFHEKISKR